MVAGVDVGLHRLQLLGGLAILFPQLHGSLGSTHTDRRIAGEARLGIEQNAVGSFGTLEVGAIDVLDFVSGKLIFSFRSDSHSLVVQPLLAGAVQFLPICRLYCA